MQRIEDDDESRHVKFQGGQGIHEISLQSPQVFSPRASGSLSRLPTGQVYRPSSFSHAGSETPSWGQSSERTSTLSGRHSRMQHRVMITSFLEMNHFVNVTTPRSQPMRCGKNVFNGVFLAEVFFNCLILFSYFEQWLFPYFLVEWSAFCWTLGAGSHSQTSRELTNPNGLGALKGFKQLAHEQPVWFTSDVVPTDPLTVSGTTLESEKPSLVKKGKMAV